MMTPRDFFRETVKRYHNARVPAYPHKRIFRGESRSIASEAEDLFARYLVDRLPKDSTIFINQTITTGSRESRQRVKPDLTIARMGLITAILDLKMDLGYQRREFVNFWDQRDAQIPSLRGREFSLYAKSGGHKTRMILNFAAHARLHFVLVSDRNINSNLLGGVLKKRGAMEHSDLFVLSHRVHPNEYGMSVQEVLQEIDIDENEFLRLELFLNQEA